MIPTYKNVKLELQNDLDYLISIQDDQEFRQTTIKMLQALVNTLEEYEWKIEEIAQWIRERN